jgi:hypothetical protein
MRGIYRTLIGTIVGLLLILPNARADGIVAKIVCSPISGTGIIQDAVTDINIYLQSDAVRGIDFMDPNVVGYGIAEGGRVEIEFSDGFERFEQMPITNKGAQAVSGTPQQGMFADKFGYEVREGDNKQTIAFVAVRPGGLPAETLMSPDADAPKDPVRQRGIKVLHIGLLKGAFINRGQTGTVNVRFIDSVGKVTHTGSASIDFLPSAVPQLHPTNFPDRLRNHNWQLVKPGDVVGKTPGTLPIPIMLFERVGRWESWRSSGIRLASRVVPSQVPLEPLRFRFKEGIDGVGVLSRRQLEAGKYETPTALSRYDAGLIVHDTNGDGLLDPAEDQIIGGVTINAPDGANGQELRSLDINGAVDLSRPTTAFNLKIGRAIGGAIGLLQFSAGDKPGVYRPTLALLSDPDDPASADGASYTFTIVVE